MMEDWKVIKFMENSGKVVDIQADIMTRPEFEKTQSYTKNKVVYIRETEEAFYCIFSCDSNACNHMSHPPKKWVKFDPQTGVHLRTFSSYNI